MTRPLHSRHCNVIPARPAGRKTYRGSVLPARGLALPDPRLIDRATSAFGFSRRRCRWLFQIGQDRAIGPIVSRAAHHQLLERASHLLHVRDPLPQIFDMAQGDALDVRSGQGGQILKRGHELAQVLKVFEKGKFSVVD